MKKKAYYIDNNKYSKPNDTSGRDLGNPDAEGENL